MTHAKKPTGKSLSELHSPAEKPNNPNPEEVARSLVKSLSSPEHQEISTTDQCATGSTSRSKTQSDAEAQSDDAKEDHSESLCARCKKPGTIVCKCQQVYYCSSACQKLELPVHSEKCSPPSHHHPAPGNQSSTSSAKAEKIQSKKSSFACARCKKPASLISKCPIAVRSVRNWNGLVTVTHAKNQLASHLVNCILQPKNPKLVTPQKRHQTVKRSKQHQSPRKQPLPLIPRSAQTATKRSLRCRSASVEMPHTAVWNASDCTGRNTSRHVLLYLGSELMKDILCVQYPLNFFSQCNKTDTYYIIYAYYVL